MEHTLTKKERLERIEKIVKFMDEKFSIIGIRVGLDSIIGLFPVVGDVIGGLISIYIVWQATLLGVPWDVIRVMLINVVVDVLVGGVPIAGDLFDVFFKANKRNLNLIHRYFEQAERYGTDVQVK